MHKIIYGMVQRKRLRFPPCPPWFNFQHFPECFSWCCLDLLTALVRTVYRGLIMSIKLILHWPVARSHYKKIQRDQAQKTTNTCQRPFLTSDEFIESFLISRKPNKIKFFFLILRKKLDDVYWRKNEWKPWIRFWFEENFPLLWIENLNENKESLRDVTEL